MTDFITIDDFDKLTKKETEILSFVNLEKNVIYKIMQKEDKDTEYGQTFILTLNDKDGNEYKVFAPDRLYKELKEKADEYEIAYVRPLGLKRSKKIRNRSYHDYDLLLK